MIGKADFDRLLEMLGDVGRDDVDWAESLGDPKDPEEFAAEAIYVVCNSGMRFTVARGIYTRVMEAVRNGRSAGSAFGHKHKAASIDKIWNERRAYFEGFMAAVGPAERLAWCGTLPHIGGITKFHLAKNFGVQVAKPDVHLQRLADREGVTAQQLCERLAGETGFKIATIDTVLWRACALGILSSKTGSIQEVSS